MSKKQTASLMIKAIVLLLALILMVFAASLAWYRSPEAPVNADGLSLEATAGKYFDMAVGFESSKNGYQYTMSQYTKNLNLRDIITADGQHFDTLADFSPVDITGDGVTLVRPSMLLKNKDIDRASNTFTTVSPNKEYICFDMYFRAEDPCKVFLDDNSYVKGVIEDVVGDGNLIQTESTDGNRKASEGDFSKDAVVGAVRVSFVNYNSFVEGDDPTNLHESARVLWLPRPDIHLNANNTTEGWTLSTGLTPDNTITDYFGATDRFRGYPADTFTHHYYSYKKADDNHIIGDVNYQNTITDPKMNAICDVNTKIGDYYYGKTQVNIWVEGCDAEARRAIAGGQFQVNFDLAGG